MHSSNIYAYCINKKRQQTKKQYKTHKKNGIIVWFSNDYNTKTLMYNYSFDF